MTLTLTAPVTATGSAGIDWWSVLTDAGIPALALLLSTAVAIGLARRERRAADRSRLLERRDRMLEGILSELAFFATVNPEAEPWADHFRVLRAQVVLLQTLPGASNLAAGRWLAAECQHGTSRMAIAMQAADQLPASMRDPLVYMEGTHRWAQRTTLDLAKWMRNDLRDEDLRAREKTLTKLSL